MCTLIIGQGVVEPRTVILAGNRDEDPLRPSRPPALLSGQPHLVGGRDAVAGGTWMAVRERRAVVAMLNRWVDDGPAPPMAGVRSRGQLALDLARAMDDLPFPHSEPRNAIREALLRADHAPFSAVLATPAASWILTHDGPGYRSKLRALDTGWHVLTHRELDDEHEPRTVRLNRDLEGWFPAGPIDARARLMDLLASHTEPRVCIHEGRMVTVSSFVVWLTRNEATYHHVEGRPCENRETDYSHLLQGRLCTEASS